MKARPKSNFSFSESESVEAILGMDAKGPLVMVLMPRPDNNFSFSASDIEEAVVGFVVEVFLLMSVKGESWSTVLTGLSVCSAGRVEAVLNGIVDVKIAVARAARIRAVFILRACCLIEPILIGVEVVLLFGSFGRYGDGDCSGDSFIVLRDNCFDIHLREIRIF